MMIRHLIYKHIFSALLFSPLVLMAQGTLVPITATTTSPTTASSTQTAKSEAPQTSTQSMYCLPVDIRISLSGNVGEIRSNHFHSGIDIRGGGNTGAPVYSVMDGYVSRIGVSPFGYGNALYVAHPNGTTSVYGHLDNFVPRIAQWVREQQYAKKSFTVNLYPPKDLFPVKSGERIASLGNSGSSGGPHLHFEIRNSANQNPINILARGIYGIADNIAPTVSRIHLFQADTVMGQVIFSHSSSVALSADKNSGKMVLRDSVLYACRPFYLAYEVTDRKNGSSFTMGIYSVEQAVNGRVNFSYRLDELSFATTRYANALAQYSLTTKTRNDVLRAYISPVNRLGMYLNVKDSGVITPPANEGARVWATTTFTDDNGNSTTVRVAIERKSIAKAPIIPTTTEKIVNCKNDFSHSEQAFNVSIPSGALYDNHIMPLYESQGKYYIGHKDIPLQKEIKVIINTTIEASLRDKVLVLNSRGGSAGGTWKNGVVELSTRTLGEYSIGYDTIAPRIEPLAVGKGNLLRFKVTDNLSGVASYTLTVDGKWALLEYDPKNALMFYRFNRSSTPRSHQVTITVTDGKGNSGNHKSTVQW